MADGQDPNPDSEARKWFVIAMVCAVLFIGVVFSFVINGPVDPASAQREEPQHEQHN